MPDTTAAEAAFTTAAERHRARLGAVEAARAAVITAVETKHDLIASATAGATITAADVRAAEEVARDADAACSLAESAMRHSAREMAAAEADMFRSRAGALVEQVRATGAAMTTAGDRLDTAHAAAMCLAAAFNTSAEAHATARREAAAHDRLVDQLSPGNEILAGEHRSVHPLTHVAEAVRVAPLQVELFRILPWAHGQRETIADASRFADEQTARVTVAA